MLLILEFLFLAVLIVGPAILFITKETNTTPISGIIIWILLLYVFRRAIKKRKANKIKLKEEEIAAEKHKHDTAIAKRLEQFDNLLQICIRGQDIKAMYNLANIYFEGTLVEKNYVEAIYWITKSELLGSPEAPKLRKKIQRKASKLHIASAIEKIKDEHLEYSNLHIGDMDKKSLFIYYQKN